jgi:dienelactone hydrolase
LYGAYRFTDGRLISVRASVGDSLRVRVFETGASHRLYPKGRNSFVSGPGFSSEEPVTLSVQFAVDAGGQATGMRWMQQGAPPEVARKVGTTQEVVFRSGRTRLYGRLDLPDSPGPHPGIVLVHGSGKDAATDYYYSADFFAANGIAALTFDKRGTGRSQGKFTMDYHALARDVLAGVDWLRASARINPNRIGLTGYSQGGWVAPLTASLSNSVRYVIVNCGMIESPAEEARMETMMLVRKRGVTDAEALRAIESLTVAAVEVVASGFRTGWEAFATLRDAHAGAPWRKHLRGSPVDRLMRYPRWLAQLIGPLVAPAGLDWHYGSDDLLATLDVPMLWLLASADESAPNELTIPKLRKLRDAGRPIDVIVYDGADHGMLLFNEVDGQRQYTGYASGYFSAEVRFALEQLG